MIHVIEFESVSRASRRGSAPVTDVTFAAHQNQITVLLGEPGSGTSTVLRMINRLIEPADGRIMINGKPLRTLRRKALRRGQGFLLREGGLFPHRDAAENIAMVPRVRSAGRGKALTEANDLLREVGLDRATGRLKPSRLTAAQRQRVCLARAIAGEPTMVLLDHPFGDLDPGDRGDLQALLRRLHGEREFTAIVATDDVDEALAIADRLVVFGNGTVIDAGPPEAVLDAQNPLVAEIVGTERGYRALAYATTIGLPLQRVPVVRDPASAGPDAGATLLVDNDAVPLGWVDPERAGSVLPLGDVFDPGSGSLQEALNAALTSPVGLAVAVTRGTGRYAGVLSAAEIVAAAVEQRTAAVRAGLESVEAAPSRPAPTSPRSPEVVLSESDQETEVRPVDKADQETEVRPVEESTPDETEEPAEAEKPGTTMVARRAQSAVDKVRPAKDDAKVDERQPVAAGGRP